MKLSQFLITFAWVVYLFSYFFTQQSDFASKYSLRTPYYITLVFCAVIVGIKIFVCDKLALSRLAIIVAVLGILMISGIRSSDYSVVMIGIFAVGMKDIDFKSLLRTDLVCKIIIFVSIISLSLVGVLENYVAVVDGYVKHSYGFYHPNMLGTLLGAILIENLYLRFHQFSYIDYFLYILAEVVCAYVSRTRSMILLLTLVLVFFVLIKRFNILGIKHVAVKYALILTPVICLLFTLFVMLYYRSENSVWYAFNRAMSGRLNYARYFWENYGPSLLGQRINLISSRAARHTQALILDNCYARLLIMFGVIPTIMLCLALMRQIRNAIALKDYQLLVIVVYFCLLGLLENYFIRPAYNITLILLLYYDTPITRPRIKIKLK